MTVPTCLIAHRAEHRASHSSTQLEGNRSITQILGWTFCRPRIFAGMRRLIVIGLAAFAAATLLAMPADAAANCSRDKFGAHCAIRYQESPGRNEEMIFTIRNNNEPPALERSRREGRQALLARVGNVLARLHQYLD